MSDIKTYTGPYSTVHREGRPDICSSFLKAGFVELRKDDTVLAVLQPGDLVGLEWIQVDRGSWDYDVIAAGCAVLTPLPASNGQLRMLERRTTERLLAWMKICSIQDAQTRLLAVLRELMNESPGVRISTQELARLSRLSRVWATKVVQDLCCENQLVHDRGVFSIGPRI